MLNRLDAIKQRHGEPVTSFFARIAANYGLTSARELALDFELNYGHLVAGNIQALRKLAEITGGDFDSLVKFSPRSGGTGNSLQLAGHPIALTFSRRKHLYGCTECWAQDMAESPNLVPEAAAYIRLPWLFTPVRTCTRHNRPLIMVKEASSRGHLYDTALMAMDLKLDLPALLADGKRRQASAFEHYVEARLLGLPCSAGVLDKIGINEVFTVCGGIGKTLLGNRRSLYKMDDDELHAVYAKGFAVLSSEPTVLSSAIVDAVRRDHARLPANLGPIAVLGGIHEVLTKDLRGARRFEPLYGFLAHAVFDAVPIPDGMPILGVERGRLRFHTIHSASKQYGLSERTVGRYAEAAGILDKIGDGGRQRCWMDIDKAENLFNPDGGVIYLAHLTRFGLKKTHAESLLGDGLLETIVPRDGASQKLAPPIRMKEVTNLMERFLLGAEPVDEQTEGMVGLYYVSQELSGLLSRVHDLILSKQIWVGRLIGEEKPYASILVRLDQIRQIERPGKLTIGELAKATGLRISMVKAMVAAGDIQPSPDAGLNREDARPIFDIGCVEHISSTFVDLTSFAKNAKRKTFALLPELEAAGIFPVRTTREGDRILRLYLTADVRHWVI